MARRKKSSVDRLHDSPERKPLGLPQRMTIRHIFGGVPPPFPSTQSWIAIVHVMEQMLFSRMVLMADRLDRKEGERLSAEIESEIRSMFPHYWGATRRHWKMKRENAVAAFKDLCAAFNDLRRAADQTRKMVDDLPNKRWVGKRQKWEAGIREIDAWGAATLKRFDKALLECVGSIKCMVCVKLIQARIVAAEVRGDNDFFDKLAGAIRRSVIPHKGAKTDIAVKAAAMLDDGLSWQEAYARLYEADEIEPIGGKEFYKLLQRHGIIPRKKHKSSSVTRGEKI